MTFFDILSNCIFRIVGFLPYLILALLPFREHLRVPPRKAKLFMILIVLLDLSFMIWSQFTQAFGLATLLVIILYITYFLIFIRTTPGKILFTLFMILNYAVMVTVISNFYLYSIIKCSNPSRLVYALSLLIVLLFTYPIIWVYVKHKICPLIGLTSKNNNKLWYSLWLIPAVFYGIFYYSLYADWTNSRSLLDFSTKLGNVIFVILLDFGSFLMYHLVYSLIKESESNLQLQKENHQLSLLAKQYETLQSKIEDTKKARHDLHHHLSVIDSFLQKKDINGLNNYLVQYRSSLPNSEGFPICENPIVNAVTNYYSDLAKRSNIKITYKIQIPKSLPLPDSDFCGLLGNLLENALEACLRMKAGTPYIHLTIQMKSQSMIVLIINNSYEGTINKRGNTFLSSKRKDSGVGLASVHSIVEKSNGFISFEYEEGKFCANVFLNPRDE